MGDFREFRGEMRKGMETLETGLRDMSKRLDEGNKGFEAIRLNCAHKTTEYDRYEERINRLEAKDALGGTTQKEKVGLWTAVAMTLYGAIKIIAKLFGAELP